VYEYFSLFNVLGFGVTFVVIAYLGQKAYRKFYPKK
jgi:hypothetical protein